MPKRLNLPTWRQLPDDMKSKGYVLQRVSDRYYLFHRKSPVNPRRLQTIAARRGPSGSYSCTRVTPPRS